MNGNIRVKVAVVVLVAVTLGSVGAASYAYGVQTNAGTYQTGVFAKVYGYGSEIWLNSSWSSILSISLPNVPVTAWYHVVCDGYLSSQVATVGIAIGKDSPTLDTSTYRFYSAGTSGNYRIKTGIHTERVYKLGPGAHTFYFLGAITSGTGTAAVNYHTLTVTVFTDGSVIDLS